MMDEFVGKAIHASEEKQNRQHKNNVDFVEKRVWTLDAYTKDQFN